MASHCTSGRQRGDGHSVPGCQRSAFLVKSGPREQNVGRQQTVVTALCSVSEFLQTQRLDGRARGVSASLSTRSGLAACSALQGGEGRTVLPPLKRAPEAQQGCVHRAWWSWRAAWPGWPRPLLTRERLDETAVLGLTHGSCLLTSALGGERNCRAPCPGVLVMSDAFHEAVSSGQQYHQHMSCFTSDKLMRPEA